jgi:hypothetical protein
MIRFKLASPDGSTVNAVGFLIMTIEGKKADAKGREVVFTQGSFSVFWREDSPNLRLSVEDLAFAELTVDNGDPYARFFDKYVKPRLEELGLSNHMCALTLHGQEEEEVKLWIADEPVKVDASTLIKKLGLSSN